MKFAGFVPVSPKPGKTLKGVGLRPQTRIYLGFQRRCSHWVLGVVLSALHDDGGGVDGAAHVLDEAAPSEIAGEVFGSDA